MELLKLAAAAILIKAAIGPKAQFLNTLAPQLMSQYGLGEDYARSIAMGRLDESYAPMYHAKEGIENPINTPRPSIKPKRTMPVAMK